jgi:hypothetical protein
MREVYLLACGIVLGLVARDWLESMERRIAYRAADQAADNLDLRSRWPKRWPADDEPTPAPAPAPAPAAAS